MFVQSLIMYSTLTGLVSAYSSTMEPTVASKTTAQSNQPNTTVVHLHGTQPPTISQYYASPEQFAKEVSAKQMFLTSHAAGSKASAPTPPEETASAPADGVHYADTVVDSTCNGNSMWVMNSADCAWGTEATPRICFDGEGNIQMSDYQFYVCGTECFGPYPWQGDDIGSYWPGNEDGDFGGAPPGNADATYFSAYADCANSSSNMTDFNVQYLYLSD
jgi:hypothetical protein